MPLEALINEIIDTRNHPLHFPRLRLPKNVFPSSDATAAFRKANHAIISSPSPFFESDIRQLLSEAEQSFNLIIVTRGFEQTSHRLPYQIAREVLRETHRPDVKLLVLSGPVTPAKLAENLGGSLVLAGEGRSLSNLADLFNHDGFRVYTCQDPIGVQLAGTMIEAYSLLGAYLLRTKEIQGRSQVASFIVETFRRSHAPGRGHGRKKRDLPSQQPGLGGRLYFRRHGRPQRHVGKKAGQTTRRPQRYRSKCDQEPKGQRIPGPWGIMPSARLISFSKKYDLDVPRLRQAYRIFWKE